MRARRARRPQVTVRDGPRGRRLLIDRTVASWWRPGEDLTGSVWDALVAPIVVLPPGRRRSLAILGLGGGSAARLARTLAPTAHIVGVERDHDVLRAARRSFDLDGLGVEVHRGDARRWLERERRRFDLIIDDVFEVRARRAQKPDWVLTTGLGLAVRRLAPGGVLVSNSIDEGPAVARRLGALRSHLVELRIDGLANRIFVASSRELDARGLRRLIAEEPLLERTVGKLRLRTRA